MSSITVSSTGEMMLLLSNLPLICYFILLMYLHQWCHHILGVLVLVSATFHSIHLYIYLFVSHWQSSCIYVHYTVFHGADYSALCNLLRTARLCGHHIIHEVHYFLSNVSCYCYTEIESVSAGEEGHYKIKVDL